MPEKAKLMFQVILLLPMVAACVLLVSLFPPYRRNTKSPARRDEHDTDASAFSPQLAEDTLAPKKG